MTFSTELDLRNVALKNLPEMFDKHDDLHVFEEFDYGAGRTDVVLSGTSNSYLSRREKLGIKTAIRKSDYLNPFLILHRKGKITIEYFKELLSDIYDVKSALDWLKSNNFVWQDDDKIRTAPNLRRHVTTSYAIEFKLSDWKRGLAQCTRAKSYAEYQYVAIDAEKVHRALNNIQKFENHNVGVISISENGNCSIEYSPERETPCMPANAWRVNELTLLRQ